MALNGVKCLFSALLVLLVSASVPGYAQQSALPGREGAALPKHEASRAGHAGKDGIRRAGNPSSHSSDYLIRRKIAEMEAVSGDLLTDGNSVALLIDASGTYTAMLRTMQNAKDYINLETFGIINDEMGRRFADVMLRKRSEGVRVNLLYDSAGSFHAPASFFERLRRGGVRVLEYNPVNPFRARGSWRPTRRDHRKILIADGKTAITGSINISEVYSTGLFSDKGKRVRERRPWRDTDVLIKGPVVAEFERLFLAEWKRQQGPPLSLQNDSPDMTKEGDDRVEVLGSHPGQMSKVMYRMYLSAISSSEKTVHLTNSYFVPDERIHKALIDAAARGVDVKIIVPYVSDIPAVLHAERYYDAELLRAGVKIYECRNAILHAKTAVIDGVWSTVGSTNLDYWSLFYDNEVNAVVLSRGFAAKMEKMFDRDIRNSNEIKLAEWKKRPFSHKIREWLAHIFVRWM
jgi:cardiolipin synthase